MSKTTINISQQLISSIFIGFIISIIIVIIAHLFPSNWAAMPKESSGDYVPITSKVSSCGYECMLGERHSADCSGLSLYQINDKKLSIDEIFSVSFSHSSTIFLLGFIISLLIYVLKRVNFKVVKN